MKYKKLIENKAKCLLCGDVVISTDEQKVQVCSCGSLLVDGGTNFRQRGCYAGRENVEDLSVFEEVDR